MRAKGYSTYRGKSPLKTFLKIFAIIVVVLAVLAVAAYFYLQQFLVFSEDGVYLDLPPFLQWITSGSEDSDEPDDLESAAPTPSITPEEEQTPPIELVMPSQKPEPVNLALTPVSLPLEALYDGTAASQIEAAAGDCALFDMKADSGQLGYVSALEMASSVSSSEHAVNIAVQQLNQEDGMYTVARVSCFKDHAIGNSKSYAILTNSGYLWTDPNKIRWISPTSTEVQDYVTAICVELAELGFDEILLDNAGYPDKGNLHYIKKGAAYDAAQFSTVISDFYNKVSGALAGYDVKLSVVTTQEALDGTDTLTGQTPDNLAGFSRCWMRGGDGVLAPLEAIQPS